MKKALGWLIVVFLFFSLSAYAERGGKRGDSHGKRSGNHHAERRVSNGEKHTQQRPQHVHRDASRDKQRSHNDWHPYIPLHPPHSDRHCHRNNSQNLSLASPQNIEVVWEYKKERVYSKRQFLGYRYDVYGHRHSEYQTIRVVVPAHYHQRTYEWRRSSNGSLKRHYVSSTPCFICR